MVDGLVTSFLLITGLQDLKSKTVDWTVIAVYGIIGIIYQVITGYQNVYQVIGGILLGIVLVAISFLTRFALGVGDGIIICITGIYLGLLKNLELLFFSMLLCFVFCIGLIFVARPGRKKKIPFVPFLFAAEIYLLIAKHVLQVY